MAKVELKKPVVEEIANSINGAASVVLVSYKGITVEQDTKMRKELREAGVTYKVYKNTMMNFAFKGTPCEELCQHLEGTNALAVCTEDATARVVEDTYYDKAGIEALSKVPSREELLGKLLGSIQSPITNFARVLNQIAEQQGGAAAE